MYNIPMRLKAASLMVAFCFAGSLQTAQACVCSGPAVNDRETPPSSGMQPLCLREKCQRALRRLLRRLAASGA